MLLEIEAIYIFECVKGKKERKRRSVEGMSLECVRFQPSTTDNVYLLLSLAEMRSEVITSVVLSGYNKGMSGRGVT